MALLCSARFRGRASERRFTEAPLQRPVTSQKFGRAHPALPLELNLAQRKRAIVCRDHD